MSDALSPDRLAAIRATCDRAGRATLLTSAHGPVPWWLHQYSEDVPDLLAEVERLRDEAEDFLASARRWKERWQATVEDAEKARAERDEARAEVERLHAHINAESDYEALLRDERDALARWKAEALPVIAGLQEVGQALGVELGERITGRATVDRALDLHNQRDALARQLDTVRVLIAPIIEEPRVASRHYRGCEYWHADCLAARISDALDTTGGDTRETGT